MKKSPKKPQIPQQNSAANTPKVNQDENTTKQHTSGSIAVWVAVIGGVATVIVALINIIPPLIARFYPPEKGKLVVEVVDDRTGKGISEAKVSIKNGDIPLMKTVDPNGTVSFDINDPNKELHIRAEAGKECEVFEETITPAKLTGTLKARLKCMGGDVPPTPTPRPSPSQTIAPLAFSIKLNNSDRYLTFKNCLEGVLCLKGFEDREIWKFIPLPGPRHTYYIALASGTYLYAEEQPNDRGHYFMYPYHNPNKMKRPRMPWIVEPGFNAGSSHKLYPASTLQNSVPTCYLSVEDQSAPTKMGNHARLICSSHRGEFGNNILWDFVPENR